MNVIRHALNFPEEVKTWIVSRNNSKLTNNNTAKTAKTGGRTANDIVPKYLPIHIVCLQKNPRQELLLGVRNIFPKGLKMRDRNGNLSIHYLLAEGCDDLDSLDIAMDEEYTCLGKKDGEGGIF